MGQKHRLSPQIKPMPKSIKYSPQENAALRNEGMTLSEIAKALDMEYNDVRNTLYRAIYKIRNQAHKQGILPEDFYDTERSKPKS